MVEMELYNKIHRRFPVWPFQDIKVHSKNGNRELSFQPEQLLGADTMPIRKFLVKKIYLRDNQGRMYKLRIGDLQRVARIRQWAVRMNNQWGITELIMGIREESIKEKPNIERVMKRVLAIPEQGKRGIEPTEATKERLENNKLRQRLHRLEFGEDLILSPKY